MKEHSIKTILGLGLLAGVAIVFAYGAFNINTKADDAYVNGTNPYASTSPLLSVDTRNNATSSDTSKQETNKNTKNMQTATLFTNKGNITVELKSETPLATENFIKLAGDGFYNGVRFHRVIAGFMIQTGDPQSKDFSLKSRWGTGGPGYKFKDELTGRETYPQGTLAMANSGPNTNGSQFFIVTAKNAPLPPSYTVFGKVTSGIENALAIESVRTEENDRPVEDIIISKISVQ